MRASSFWRESSGAKSGTNWMLYVTHLIRAKGDLGRFPFEDVMLATPPMNMLQVGWLLPAGANGLLT